MHILTPDDLIDKFDQDQNVVFVGNSGALKDEKLGTWIDNHDVVVRFNECPLKGFETDVGSKTNILVTNPYPSNRVGLLKNDSLAVLCITPQTRRPRSTEFSRWVGNNPVLFTYTPDIVQVGDVNHKVGLTTGTYGLALLQRILRPRSISITGFTMFQGVGDSHYWSTSLPKGVSAHDMYNEGAILIKICNSFKWNTIVTEEISWLAEKVNTPLAESIHVKQLNDPYWKSLK